MMENRTQGSPLDSAYERWTWGRCRDRILSLKHRLGYGPRLWILGFEVTDQGRLLDPFHGAQVFDPATAGPAVTIPSQYSAVPEMYCLLHTYAGVAEIALSGDPLSLADLDPVGRPELRPDECADLLRYARQDLAPMREVDVPFFGQPGEGGDLCLNVWPLPRVPVTIRLWRGDEEMPAGGSLLFDSSARQYVPGLLLELGWLTLWRLRNILDPEIRWGYHAMA
jgi:hypothetical protein